MYDEFKSENEIRSYDEKYGMLKLNRPCFIIDQLIINQVSIHT